MLDGAAELRQSWEGVQGLLGAEGLALGQCVDLVKLVQSSRSWFPSVLQGQDEGAKVSVKQLHPLDGLSPQV